MKCLCAFFDGVIRARDHPLIALSIILCLHTVRRTLYTAQCTVYTLRYPETLVNTKNVPSDPPLVFVDVLSGKTNMI